MELYQKYRPTCLSEVFGNKDLIQSLQEKIESSTIPHTILLTGPHGCGKTTIGRIIKEVLGIKGEQNPDYKELDTAQFRGIDTIRDIRKAMKFKPIKSPARLWLLDEAHMLGRGGDSAKNEAQNALLKALEGPPEHTYFILCTTNPEMLLGTIRSRCVEYEVKLLSPDQMTLLLKRICKKENKEIPKEVLKKICETSGGHVRDSLQILNKIIGLTDKKQMLRIARTSSDFEKVEVKKLCQALLNGQSWNSVRPILKGLQSQEAESLRRAIIGYANAALLNGHTGASLILGWFLYKNTYDSGFPLISQFCFNILNNIEPPC